MSELQKSPDAVHRLLEFSFRKSGIHNKEIHHCRQLSRMIQDRLGRTLSASTIFRMTRPEKYSLRHYRSTVDLLLEYCGIDSLDQVPIVVKKEIPPVLIEAVADQQPDLLAAALRVLLDQENPKLLFTFLDSVPEDFSFFSWQQCTISHTLANHIRSQKNSLKATQLFKEYNQHPLYQRHYTMSFPDFDFMDHYFYPGIEAHVRGLLPATSLAIRLEAPDYLVNDGLGRDVYHYCMYIWMSYLKQNMGVVRDMGMILFTHRETEMKVRRAIEQSPVLTCRFLTAQYLYCHVLGDKKGMQASVKAVLDCIERHLFTPQIVNDVAYMVTLLCDAMVLAEEPIDQVREYLHVSGLLQHTSNMFEPAHLRFTTYGSSPVTSPEQVISGSGPRYVFGFYELQLSDYILSQFHHQQAARNQ